MSKFVVLFEFVKFIAKILKFQTFLTRIFLIVEHLSALVEAFEAHEIWKHSFFKLKMNFCLTIF